MRKVNKKEKWDKPKLTILTRGKPDESVLAVCKQSGTGQAGPMTTATLPCQLGCGFCNAKSPS